MFLKDLDYHIVGPNDRELLCDNNGHIGSVSHHNYFFAPEVRIDFVRDAIRIDKEPTVYIGNSCPTNFL